MNPTITLPEIEIAPPLLRAATLEALYRADFLIACDLEKAALGENNRHRVNCLLTARADVGAAIEALGEVK